MLLWGCEERDILEGGVWTKVSPPTPQNLGMRKWCTLIRSGVRSVECGHNRVRWLAKRIGKNRNLEKVPERKKEGWSNASSTNGNAGETSCTSPAHDGRGCIPPRWMPWHPTVKLKTDGAVADTFL